MASTFGLFGLDLGLDPGRPTSSASTVHLGLELSDSYVLLSLDFNLEFSSRLSDRP
jgi:hypothetical protein